MTQTLTPKVLIIGAVALGLCSAPAADACSMRRVSPSDMRAAQARALSESDLIFLARVAGYGQPSDLDDNEIVIVFYEPIEMISEGDLPVSLSVSFWEICGIRPPPIGETRVILMRAADLSEANRSGTAGLTSTILGSYDIADIRNPRLRRRVDRALERADIE